MNARKKEEKERMNLEKLTKTISTLDTIIKNRDIHRNNRNLVKDALATLKNEHYLSKGSKCREHA